MITTLLWDVDGTLLDFAAAERVSINRLFEEYGFGVCTEEMLRRYSEINDCYWKRLERGEIAKQEVLVGRFRDFLRAEGRDAGLAAAWNAKYQNYLGDTIVYRDDSLEIVRSLHGRVRQYVVSNGTVAAQTKKLRLSGLGAWMEGIFLSEQLGAEKPDIRFFEKVFAELEETEPSRILIVGDSLTSDIRGGNNAGIVTCWYNPQGAPLPDGYEVRYEIADLHEVPRLLG